MQGIRLFFIYIFSFFLNTATFANVDNNDTSKDTIEVFKKFIIQQFKTDCEPLIEISGNEPNMFYLYWAGENINVNKYNISQTSGSGITMKAGKMIVLSNGSYVKRGTKYLARIEPCVVICDSGFSYDKFFSPNGDGKHDFWNLHDVANVTDVKVFIYDRYGKVVSWFSYPGIGWDGQFNSESLPATDYWFKVTYKDCKGEEHLETSHFSLLR